MRTRTLLLLPALLLSAMNFAQSDDEFHAPRFVKYPVGESGASVYFPESEDLVFDLSYSEDSSKIFTGDVPAGDFHYALILVQFEGFTFDTEEERDALLVSYLDHLQSTYSIVSSAGYGKGHRLARDESAEGIIDFWLDEDGDEWSVKAWVKPTGIAVMCIYGPESFPNPSVSEFFFNGITF